MHDDGIRRPQQRSNRCHQFHVTGPHSVDDIKQQEDSASEDAAGERTGSAFPPQQQAAQQHTQDDSGIGEPVGDAALLDVDNGGGDGQGERGGEKHEIGIHGATKLANATIRGPKDGLS